MRSTDLDNLRELSGGLDSLPTFKILTVYENQGAFAQARKIERHLATLCKDDMQIISLALHFSVLGDPPTWNHAVVAADNADVIIVAASGMNELPASVFRWIDHWPRRSKSGHAALVITCDPGSEMTIPQYTMSSYFRQVAENRGLDFFCNRIFGMQ
jgi:hypothetical protein